MQEMMGEKYSVHLTHIFSYYTHNYIPGIESFGCKIIFLTLNDFIYSLQWVYTHQDKPNETPGSAYKVLETARMSHLVCLGVY